MITSCMVYYDVLRRVMIGYVMVRYGMAMYAMIRRFEMVVYSELWYAMLRAVTLCYVLL